MRYAISIQRSAPRTIAAVRARLAPGQISRQFRPYLDEVYAARSSGLELDGQNTFVYTFEPNNPGLLDCDFGVGVRAPFAQVGNVRPVDVPGGEVATTTHVGPYAGLGGAHDAIQAWCRDQSRALGGVSWEVYGHWSDTEPPCTDIYYLLRS